MGAPTLDTTHISVTHHSSKFRSKVITAASPPTSTAHNSHATSTTITMATTLFYFDLPGRAEATRIALTVAGVKFEDKRFSFPEFGASSFNALPVLQMDGTDYTQSIALLRYAGSLGGIYPADALTALRVDEIVMALEDINVKLFSTLGENDEAKKLEMCQSLMAGKVKTILKELEGKLAANGSSSRYCVGDSLTIADLQLVAVVKTIETGFLQGIPTTMIADMAPSLQDQYNKIMTDPQVKEFYAAKA